MSDPGRQYDVATSGREAAEDRDVPKWDVAIIGTGIGGSTLAAILARQGLSVIVFEAGQHPRFTIGESMILETSEVMRALAEFYDVPELAYFSSENYYDFIGTSHGVKRHFSFLHHADGERQQVARGLQAVIPRLPYGHEIHIHRQDCDYFLTAVAISYGARVLQNTPVRDVRIEPSHVEIVTEKQAFVADFVVDAGGVKSVLAEKYGGRHRDLQTHTRAIYTHMIDVPCFNDVGPSQREYGHPFRLSEGTLHHLFKGGWLWVIPFNNHARATNPLCSVGLQLDPRVYPLRPDLTPEEEFQFHVDRFPEVREQFKRARPVRAWTRIDRLQYASTNVVGDRFALLAHAAGFIDPLYSKGLYLTHVSVFRAADLILKARKTGDWSRDAFLPLERLTHRYVRMHDRLVANSFKSWGNYDLWSVYAVLWLLGAYQEYLKLTVTRLRSVDRADYLEKLGELSLAGGGFAPFFELQENVDQLVEKVDPENEADVQRTVAEIRSLYAAHRWMPSAFRDLLKGKNFLPSNKLRVNLLNRQDGFLGDGAYREHFFGDTTLGNLVAKALREQTRYSRPALKRRKRKRGRLAWRPVEEARR